ncbi:MULTISPECIES: SDR family NAD(P)-dependent oxidoreductase [unclassified Micrococcus]|uniref:SDR family NAD(P)-dependent oxidoreductase n=1 Tax=unclassified Micrococcus TaxID=2620948 RepID=UPI00249F77E7|nr:MULTISPECIES: SDR family NAD(P)-dependent oxidoreductase [unclassified Micrococcus]
MTLPAGSLEATARRAGVDPRFTAHPRDITDHDGIGRRPEEVVAAHGRVDGLLDVGGIIQQFVRDQGLDEQGMRRAAEVNLWGAVNTCHAFTPLVLDRPDVWTPANMCM